MLRWSCKHSNGRPWDRIFDGAKRQCTHGKSKRGHFGPHFLFCNLVIRLSALSRVISQTKAFQRCVNHSPDAQAYNQTHTMSITSRR